MIKEILYTETNRMHFDSEDVLGAKTETGGKIPPGIELYGEINRIDSMFCNGLLDIFGLEKTNQLLAAKPVTHVFYLDENAECKGRFAEEITAYIIENSTEAEAEKVKTLHEACIITHMWHACEVVIKASIT